MILQTLLTLALIHPDRWYELSLWEMEQGSQIIWNANIDEIKIYSKNNEIIWVMPLEKDDKIAASLIWDKILIFGEGNEECQYTSENIKRIKKN